MALTLFDLGEEKCNYTMKGDEKPIFVKSRIYEWRSVKGSE